jgi:hypothetical protein
VAATYRVTLQRCSVYNRSGVEQQVYTSVNVHGSMTTSYEHDTCNRTATAAVTEYNVHEAMHNTDCTSEHMRNYQQQLFQRL